jgi:hypothetical protein
MMAQQSIQVALPNIQSFTSPHGMSAWTLGPKPLGSQKQIPALTLIETCGVRFADAFLQADFAVRFAGKLDPDILS